MGKNIQQSLLMLKIILICVLLINKSESQPGPKTGTITGIQRGWNDSVSLAGYGAGQIIQIRFTVTNNVQLTTASLIVSTQGDINPNSIQPSDFYHQDPLTIQAVDLDAMWSARTQYINIQQPVAPNPLYSTLYLTIFKFDPTYRAFNVNFQIDFGPIGQSTRDCASCVGGQAKIPGTCICQNCIFNRIGKTCSRNLVKIQNNVTTTLSPAIHQYYILQNTNKITVQIKVTGGQAQAYFQFQQFNQQVASFYNVAKGTSDGRYLINSNSLKVGADTQQRSLLITIVSLSQYPIEASITYTEQSSVSVLVIVMAVLGGLLLVALIIAIVCVIKKRNQINARVGAENTVSTEANKLSGEQIQRYFPQWKYSQVTNFSAISSNGINNSFVAQTSMNQIHNANQKQIQQTQATDQDCVICLQNISFNDQIRIGYCKHIFHGPCLIGWFKKQRNCPYCRKQYNRDQTVAQYNKLVKQNNNMVLRDLQLLRSIYARKIVSKTIVQNIE